MPNKRLEPTRVAPFVFYCTRGRAAQAQRETAMERAELLAVEHTFWINKPGISMLVLSPSFPMPRDWEKKGWSERREAVVVVRPDGAEIGATAKINVTHLSIRGPVNPRDCGRITVWLPDRTEDEVPAGSKGA